ncbi:MAG: hypothetical protein QN127_10450 [Armatimonadota bacterium]|nr:hypothetical protein [Armatimonadota bacterium]
MRMVACAAAIVVALATATPAFPQNPGETLILQRINAVYGTAFDDLEGLVQKMRTAGMGWGEIIIVLHLAVLSGRSVDQILTMRDGGLGFGEIARALGIHPGELGKAVAAVMSEGRSTEGLERAAEARERARGRP